MTQTNSKKFLRIMEHIGAVAGDQTPPRLHVNVLLVSLLPVIEYPEAQLYTTVSDTLYEAARLPVELFSEADGGELQPASIEHNV